MDGDTLQIDGTRIRLHGIDAPESGQSCTVRGAQVPCGRLATMALADKIGGRPVTCEPKARDRYDRIVAVCRSGDENLNAWMAANGWAMAYRQYSWDYLPEELSARWHAVGIWEGDFVAPWVWRHQP